MTRKYIWTVQIEIDADTVENEFKFGDDLAFNDATAYDMVVDGLLQDVPADAFRARSLCVQRPDDVCALGIGPIHIVR